MPTKDEAQSGHLPPKTENPHVYALGLGFGVSSVSEMQSVSEAFNKYRCKLTLYKCDIQRDSLAIVPKMEVWLDIGLKNWPEFAVAETKGLANVAFTVDTPAGRALFAGRCRLPELGTVSGDKPVILEDRRRVLPRVQIETFSFIESHEGSGSQGVVGNGEDGIWLGTPNAGDDQGQLHLTKFYGKSGFCTKGIHVSEDTFLIFCIEGRNGGPVKVLQCKKGKTDWVLHSERLLDKKMLAQRLAIREREGKLFLLTSMQTPTGHQLQMFCSADKGETWTIAGLSAIERPGTLVDLALSNDCASAAAIVHDAGGEGVSDTVVRVSLRSYLSEVSATPDDHVPADGK